MHRFFVDKKIVDNKIIPDKKFLHQLTRIIRIKRNEEFIIINNNTEYVCNLISNKIVIIKKLPKREASTSPKIILVQGVPKNNKLVFILQKVTEIGVDSIYLWSTIRSTSLIVNYEKKIERFEEIVKEASEQSNRVFIPDINYIKSISELKFKSDDLLLALYEKSNFKNDSIINYLKELKNYKRIFIFVGPEGGFSEEEIGVFKLKEANFVSVGENILRSETAAIVGITLVKYFI